MGCKPARSVAKSCPTLCKPVDCSLTGSSVHGDSPGKNTGVGFHFLLQGIFPNRGWNPRLLHQQKDSLPLSHQGSPFVRLSDTQHIHNLPVSPRETCPLSRQPPPLVPQPLRPRTHFLPPWTRLRGFASCTWNRVVPCFFMPAFSSCFGNHQASLSFPI